MSLRDRWVAALRSGKYEQGQGELKTVFSSGTVFSSEHAEYCCLGVLCDVKNPDGWIDGTFTYNGHDYTSSLPHRLRKTVGIDSDVQDVLIDMNDVQGRTFLEIADYLETLP